MNYLQGRHPGVVFACVCVEGLFVAKEFSRCYLGRATNCVVDQADLPRFPAQLGCSGFVIVDAAGKFVTTKSSAFLDVGEKAFQDVERLLGAAAAAPPAAASAPPPPPPAAMESVGHAELDAEHDEIASLLDAACSLKSAAALEAARDAFRDHSAHEEQVMREVGFGQGAGLSAAASHAKDHARIVALADAALAEAAEAAEAPWRAPAPSVKELKAVAKARGASLAGCVEKGDMVEAVHARGGALVDAAPFAAAVLRHTKNFDALYVDAVKAAAAPCKPTACAGGG